MRQLIVRFLNVAVIAAVLIGYNTVLDKRDKEDQIARLSAELETTQLQKENLQAAAAASNTADTAASEAAEAEGQYVDGTYDGEADGFGGTIAVEVTVEGGQITGKEEKTDRFLPACRNPAFIFPVSSVSIYRCI